MQVSSGAAPGAERAAPVQLWAEPSDSVPDGTP